MQSKRTKFSAVKLTACALLAAVMATSGICGIASVKGFAEQSTQTYFNKIAAFDTGNTNADGGTGKIIPYNAHLSKMEADRLAAFNNFSRVIYNHSADI